MFQISNKKKKSNTVKSLTVLKNHNDKLYDEKYSTKPPKISTEQPPKIPTTTAPPLTAPPSTAPSSTVQPSTVQPSTPPPITPNQTTLIPNQTTTASTTIKRCLLIGINYIGTTHELKGSINNTANLSTFLINNKYFTPVDMITMTDMSTGVLYPTKQNIINQLNILVQLAVNNPTSIIDLFISFSGHGFQIANTNPHDPEKFDEGISPIDYIKKGNIADDYLRHQFINKLESNVNLTFLFDSPHSGSVLDLRFAYNKNTATPPFTVSSYMSSACCNVIMVSSCTATQTSVEALLPNQSNKTMYQGVMTAAFISNYIGGISYNSLLTNMRTWIAGKSYPQITQLNSGRFINTTQAFLLSSYQG